MVPDGFILYMAHLQLGAHGELSLNAGDSLSLDSHETQSFIIPAGKTADILEFYFPAKD